ncbi:MAG: restriction endonuclease subunit S [Leptospirales bacterium]
MSRHNWPTIKLGELFKIKHGFAFKGEYFADTGDFILLTPGNFKEEGGLKLKGEKEKFYSGQFPDEYLLKQGDIVVAMTDLTQTALILGSSAVIPESGKYLHNQRLGKVFGLNTDRALPEFVFYLFNAPSLRGQVKGSATGATVKHTAPSRIYDVTAPLPPLPIQQRIAGILSAYDELIENSQRRIKILESMARALYREWFVHFRYPGHENHARVASPLGEIPEGWEVCKVKDIATVTYGFPFASKKFNIDGNGTPVIRIRDIREGLSTTFTEEDPDPKHHVKNGHILVGMDGDFHMCIWSSGHAFQNQRVARFESNGGIGNHHLFLALEKPIREFNKAIVGTTVAHLGDMHIKTILIVWPPAKLRKKAQEFLEPMSEQIVALKCQIQNLRRTRDLLLPRLLSGQIDVENIAS